MLRGQLLKLVPSLRRYSLCLTGSPAEGDALLTAALERILSGDLALNSDLPVRQAAFDALHRTWVPVDVPSQSGFDQLGGRLGPALGRLSPQSRAVLLLTRMHDFEAADIAIILRTSIAEVGRLRRQADELLHREFSRRVLIVEDDMLTAMELELVVTSLGHEPVGPAGSGREAIILAMREEPDLILSDIELEGSTCGIDAVQEIRRSFEVPVIFVTAFPQRLADRGVMERSYVVRKPLDRSLMIDFISNALSA